MCMIHDEQIKQQIARAVHELTGCQQSFTGYSVYMQLKTSGFLPEDFSRFEVSSYVRELFNLRDPAFQGPYGSYPVPEGPLLFFPVPEEFVNHGEEIIQKIEERKAS